MTQLNFLRVDASMNRQSSNSRMLADKLVEKLTQGLDVTVTTRDLADGVSLINEDWIGANFTDPAERSQEQQQVLAESNILVKEVCDADVLVMGVPVYNFGVPAAFKAWVDQIARARETFQYTEKGPEGLLSVKACYLILSSGGTPVGSETDFVSGYIKTLFGFLGIKDITVIGCDGVMVEGDAVVERALEQIAGLEPLV